MRLKLKTRLTKGTSAAFTLLEVVVGIALTVVLFVGLYTGVSQGFSIIQVARENLRAVQILQEKMETIRLYTWDQINAEGFIPPTFTAPFYAAGEHQDDNLTYYGQVLIADPPLDAGTHEYASDLKLVVVNIMWQSGGVTRHRTMRTFVSQYGLYRYIY